MGEPDQYTHAASTVAAGRHPRGWDMSQYPPPKYASDTKFQHNPSSRSRDTDAIRDAHVHLYPTVHFYKTQTNGFLTTYHISAQSIQPFPRYGKRVRTCSSTPSPTFVKRLANGSLTTYQIQHNPSSRLRDTHVRMYPSHDLCNCIMHRYLVSNYTPNLVTVGRAIPELWLSGPF